MKKILLPVALVILLAAAFAVFALISLSTNKPAEVSTATTTTTRKHVKVPNIIEESDVENSITLGTEQQPLDEDIQSESLNNEYSLPSPNEPEDIPPDDSEMLP